MHFLMLILGPVVLLATPASADVESMEACLAETVMVAEPDHCVGLHSDACIASGGTETDCLDREEAVWAAILKEHWSFSCQTCADGLSLSRSVRAARVADDPNCRATEVEQTRCLMQETARQAGIVFFY